MFYRPTLLALAFILLPIVCDAEVITAYDLTGKTGSEFFDSATAMAPHVNGEALLRGDGLTATTAAGASSNFGAANGVAIPEPGTLALLFMGLLAASGESFARTLRG